MKSKLLISTFLSYYPVALGFGISHSEGCGKFRCPTRHSSTADDTQDGNETPVGSLPQNPFISLLSKGLHRVSLAMDKSTSDDLFLATSSLQRLRQQVVQLTQVGPSSLGEDAGLGLFASKNIKAGTIVGLYPAHALGYQLAVPLNDNASDGSDYEQDEIQDLSMFLAGNDEDRKYFAQHPHGNSPYLHATDQPLFQRPSLLSPLFDGEEKEAPPPLYLDVNPNRNGQLDGAWTSHYINDGASLLGCETISEADVEQYYLQSSKSKNCIHIPFGPSPILATITTKKVKKGEELFTSYGVVYWLGAMEDEADADATPKMTEKIHSQILDSAKDLQKAMEGCVLAYGQEIADFEEAIQFHDK